MIEEMTVVYWTVSAFIIGSGLVLCWVFFTDNYFKVSIMNRFTRGMYMVARLQFNNNNKITKVVKKSARDIKFFESSQAFENNKESMKTEDMIPVIDFHFSNTQPAELNPISAEVVNYVLPKEVIAETSVSIPGEKKGETRTFQQQIKLTAEQLRNSGGEWVIIDQKINQIKPIAKPSDWASLLQLNDAEMETNSLLLKIKQLENLTRLQWVVIIIGALTLVAVIGMFYSQQGVNAQIISDSQLIQSYNSSIATILNRTARIPVPLGG